MECHFSAARRATPAHRRGTRATSPRHIPRPLRPPSPAPPFPLPTSRGPLRFSRTAPPVAVARARRGAVARREGPAAHA
eukprot:1530423-Prymnesium_polylepis.1